MANWKAPLEGLEDLQEELSSKRLKKSIAVELGRAAISLNAALSKEIHRRYNTNRKTLDSVWLNKSTSAQSVGNSITKISLIYKYVPRDLSKFIYDWEWGNINEGATNEGRVHSTTILRGRQSIVYGKSHFGGFVPRKDPNKDQTYSGRAYTNGKYGAQMFERKTKKQEPLRLLFGPSLTDMASYVFDHREENSIKSVLQDVEDKIEDIFYKII